MSPRPAPDPIKTAARGGKFSKWLTTHKPEAALGGAGIVVTVFLAYRAHQNSANAGTNAATTNASQALPLSYYPPTEGGGSGFANELAPILTQLSSELSGAGQASAAGGSGTVQGTWSGANPGTDQNFVPVSAGSTIPAGVQLFYEPVAGTGVFDPFGPGVPAGTQLYVAPNPSQPTGFQQGNAGGGPPVTVP